MRPSPAESSTLSIRAGHVVLALSLAAAAILVALIISATGAAAQGAKAPVEAFVQGSIDQGIAILGDKSLSDTVRQKKVSDFLFSIFDVHRVAMFCLGNAAHTASPAEVDRFTDAFQNFMLARYGSQLGAYNGETLSVTGSETRAPGDYVVSVLVVEPHPAPGDEPTPVAFRVLDEGSGKFALVDVNVEGVWFDVAQRDDVQGYLTQNNGDVDGLIAHVQEMTRALQAPTPGPASAGG